MTWLRSLRRAVPKIDRLVIYDTEVPHFHPCRPYDRARKHTNGFACFDPATLPEQQHHGYGEVCHDCVAEFNHKHPIPDDGRDDPRYGGY